MKYSLILFYLLFFQILGHTQDSTVKKPVVSRLYFDTYYSYDFARPSSGEKAPFLYNYKRHNGIHINLALASISVKREKTRANFGLMAGSYSAYNLSDEPGILKHLFEANVGRKLSQSRNLWLDAGVMPSHIGFESAIGKDCWTTTRSILAENTPYYESGIKLSYTSSDDKIYAALLLLNGWQRIKISNIDLQPAFGSQITYKPTSDFSINWSTFFGRVNPFQNSSFRYFNNFYAVYQFNNRFGITIGMDHGIQQRVKNLYTWISPVLITRYQFNNWALVARIEYYIDKSGIFVPLVNDRYFQMQGCSINIDRKIGKNILWRSEWRYFKNSSPYFSTSTGIISTNHAATTSLIIDFIQ